MLDLGTALPPFRLPRLGGGEVSSSDFDAAPALLVAFICPHCPFMRHIRRELGRFSREYLPRGLAMVGINANDESAYPDDGWDGMQARPPMAATRSPTCATSRRPWPRRIALPARRTSFSSIARDASCIAGSSTRAGPATRCR
jgi:hypothetical protein